MATGVAGKQYISQVKVFSSASPMSAPPEGFTNIVASNLNEGTSGKYLFLCYNLTEDPTTAITGLEVVAGLVKSVPVPIGYTQDGQDLNEGAWGKYIYVCSMEGNGLTVPPIEDIIVVSGNNRYVFPESTYTRINQDCNEGAGGLYVFIAYKRTQNVQVAIVGR